MRTKLNAGSGGAQTNVNGLHFEQLVLLSTLMEGSFNNYFIKDNSVFHRNKLTNTDDIVGIFDCKHGLYRFLREQIPSFVWSDFISKQLLPDQFLVINGIVNILEVKNQNGKGSVDEKLQSCLFKLQEYRRLIPMKYQIKYSYLLSPWFNRPEYKDVKEFIRASGCDYFFPYDDTGQRRQDEIHRLLCSIFV